jgi:hypothetical protein
MGYMVSGTINRPLWRKANSTVPVQSVLSGKDCFYTTRTWLKILDLHYHDQASYLVPTWYLQNIPDTVL